MPPWPAPSERCQDGLSRCRAVRRLLLGSLSVLLAGCNAFPPSEVKVSLGSGKILSVKDFEYEPAGEYSGCSVSGSILYDLKVDPQNFTGVVVLDDVVLEYAGKYRAKPKSFQPFFLDGKPVGEGVYIGEYISSVIPEPKEKREAICASKSTSDIRIVSLGEPVIALPGVKASLESKK